VTRAYVGIGSNLGDREATLDRAVAALGELEDTRVVGVSRLRDTEPVGIVDQPRFLNGAVELETSLSPRALLDALLAIERELGRVREGVPKGGPRAVDLDLLLYGAGEIDEPDLRIPHPRMAERAFVLEPLADLDPALEVPGKGPIQTLLARLHSSA
jgi:2-amino-4-hydroxy-6-hydroxymethyldihydropteridine diphosphokinase